MAELQDGDSETRVRRSTLEIVELARRHNALQREGELEALVDLVRELEPETVLEIGTCHGGSLRAWCECAADNALVISVDLPDGEFGGGYYEAQVPDMLRHRQRGQEMALVAGNSHDADVHRRVTHYLDGRQVDFLFIDGDHTYEGVQKDFADYAPMVRDGGLIVIHDVRADPRDSRNRVHEFWRNVIRLAFPRAFEILTDGDYEGCGIGVIPWEASR